MRTGYSYELNGGCSARHRRAWYAHHQHEMTSSQELEANTILSRLGVSDILKLQVEFPNIYECLKYGELNKASKFIQEAPETD